MPHNDIFMQVFIVWWAYFFCSYLFLKQSLAVYSRLSLNLGVFCLDLLCVEIMGVSPMFNF